MTLPAHRLDDRSKILAAERRRRRRRRRRISLIITTRTTRTELRRRRRRRRRRRWKREFNQISQVASSSLSRRLNNAKEGKFRF